MKARHRIIAAAMAAALFSSFCRESAGAPAAPAASAAEPSRDWPMWGGEPARNMANTHARGVPVAWDVKTGANIKWVAQLGSQSYGNPVVANGKVYVGTNNEGLKDPAIKGDRGVVMCLNMADGKLLWQAVHDKLAAGRVNDWPLQGICSSVLAAAGRIYYVNNRCELVCADENGIHDGKNDGMTNEVYQGEFHADIIWKLDMMEELGVFPHNLATSSPLGVGDLIWIVTGNGVDEGHLNLPSEAAPSFIAVNKDSGKVAWEFNNMGKILHGQWSSPSYGVVKGRGEVFFPGGDGWVHALDPLTGEEIWKFDCNPKDSVWELGGYGTRNNIIATPVFHDNKVFVGVGQDPEHGYGIGHLWAIDATGTGDVTSTHAVWHRGNKDFGRTLSSVSIGDGLLYVCDLEGNVHCLDANTGAPYWHHQLESAVWSSTMLVDGKVYIGDEQGHVTIFRHGKEKDVIARIDMGESIYSTPVVAHGVLYIMTKSKLYAIAQAE